MVPDKTARTLRPATLWMPPIPWPPGLLVFLALLVIAAAFTACGRRDSGPERDVYKPSREHAGGTATPDAEATLLRRARESEARAEMFRGATEAALAAADQAKAEKAALKAQNARDLGREAGKRSLVNTATWVRRIGYVAVGLGVVVLAVSLFAGGIALRRAGAIIGVGAGCWFVSYFILVYGYLVSETLSWVILVSLFIALAGALFYAIDTVVHRYAAGKLAGKRALQAAPAPDVMALLPVTQAVRGKLEDAWETVRSASGAQWSAPAAVAARGLLLDHGLELPLVVGEPPTLASTQPFPPERVP